MKYILNIWRLRSIKFSIVLFIYYYKRLLSIRCREEEMFLNGYYAFLIKNKGVFIKKKKDIYISRFLIKNKFLFIALRIGKHSDLFVFDQIFYEEEYSLSITKYQDHFNERNNPIIIDAGSNIGLSVLYFKIFYPQSIIYAIEPFYENYKLLRVNLFINKFQKVYFINKALWHKNSICSFNRNFRGGLDWAIRIEENSIGNVSTITVKEIMEHLQNLYKCNKIDIFKIDIEGSEKELFINESIQPYLKNIRLLVMEIHEEFIDKNIIYQILASYGFEVFEEGELSIFVNTHYYGLNNHS